jgi:hypothetical protein
MPTTEILLISSWAFIISIVGNMWVVDFVGFFSVEYVTIVTKRLFFENSRSYWKVPCDNCSESLLFLRGSNRISGFFPNRNPNYGGRQLEDPGNVFYSFGPTGEPARLICNQLGTYLHVYSATLHKYDIKETISITLGIYLPSAQYPRFEIRPLKFPDSHSERLESPSLAISILRS